MNNFRVFAVSLCAETALGDATKRAEAQEVKIAQLREANAVAQSQLKQALDKGNKQQSRMADQQQRDSSQLAQLQTRLQQTKQEQTHLQAAVQVCRRLGSPLPCALNLLVSVGRPCSPPLRKQRRTTACANAMETISRKRIAFLCGVLVFCIRAPRILSIFANQSTSSSRMNSSVSDCRTCWAPSRR